MPVVSYRTMLQVCVQGLVSLLDATDQTGGLCVIPGSHKHHDELCARSVQAQTCGGDFVMLDPSDQVR